MQFTIYLKVNYALDTPPPPPPLLSFFSLSQSSLTREKNLFLAFYVLGFLTYSHLSFSKSKLASYN